MSAATTRRGLLAGAIAGAAAPALARGQSAPATLEPKAKRPVVRRGRAIAVARGVTVVAHDMRTTIGAGKRTIDVGGQPVGVAVSPDGRIAAVTTAFWEQPGLALVDLAAGRVGARRKIGPAPGEVAFTPDGKHVVIAGGEQEGTLRVLETARWRTVAQGRIGRVPRGLAVTHDGTHAWVALNADDRLALVDLRSGRVRRELRTAALPDKIALSPDGARLLVCHGRSDKVSEIDVHSGRERLHAAGRHPSGVAWTSNGRRLVALGGESAVLELHGKRFATVEAPRGLAVSGRRFSTVSALTGQVGGGRV